MLQAHYYALRIQRHANRSRPNRATGQLRLGELPTHHGFLVVLARFDKVRQNKSAEPESRDVQANTGEASATHRAVRTNLLFPRLPFLARLHEALAGPATIFYR